MKEGVGSGRHKRSATHDKNGALKLGSTVKNRDSASLFGGNFSGHAWSSRGGEMQMLWTQVKQSQPASWLAMIFAALRFFTFLPPVAEAMACREAYRLKSHYRGAR
jgi:hypothetical protein